MTWEILVPKGKWTAKIKANKARMKAAGVPSEYVKLIASGNASMSAYCLSLRTLGERLNRVHSCCGMKGAVKRIRKLCNWAAHDCEDATYEHTAVNDRHMKSTLAALNTIANTLVAEQEDSAAALSADLDALCLY